MGPASSPDAGRPTIERQTSDGLYRATSARQSKNQTASYQKGTATMGKGDRRTRRGKVARGTFGKSRPKAETLRQNKATAAKAAAEAAAPAQG
jgi:30S ribosomal protein S31